MNTYTKEQREAWDKITGPGLYNVEGEQAYQYLCNRLKWLVTDKSDPHTVLVIGNDKNKEQFFKKMIDEGAIDDFMASPEFRFYPDYDPDGDDPDEFVPRSCWSENDTDELFCNFIRNAKVNGYNNVAAVLILDMVENELRYVDRLLKIPVWRGSTLEKNIELPVYVAVCFDEKGERHTILADRMRPVLPSQIGRQDFSDLTARRSQLADRTPTTTDVVPAPAEAGFLICA